jgi:hypothetical protein
MRFLKQPLLPKPTFVWFLHLIVLIAPFLLLSPVIFTGKTLFWGTSILQFIPWRHLAWEMISSGELPLWNPFVGMGAPLFANYQSAILYPPNWFLFLLDAIGGVGWMGWGQATLVAFHLYWAALGMIKLSKRLGIGEIGQVIAGLSFGLSGYLVDRAGFSSINSTVAWLPWILYLSVPEKIDRWHADFLSKRNLKLTLSISMLLLAGHAQIAWYILCLNLVWVVFIPFIFTHSLITEYSISLEQKPELRNYILPSLSVLSGYFLALFVAILISAVQLLPTMEYLLNSQRASTVAIDQAFTYSFWPWRFLTILAPNFFGTPVNGNYWGYGNYWEDSLYFGILPFIAFATALLRKGPVHVESFESKKNFVSQRRLKRFLIVCIIFSLLLALGKNTPVYPFLYKYVPTFDMFQAPTRFSIWSEFCFCLLAGIGIDHWRKPEGRSLYWTRLGIAAASAIMVGTGLAWLVIGNIAQTMLTATASAGFLAIGSGVFYLTIPIDYVGDFGINSIHRNGLKKNSLWGTGLVLFVALDLIIAGWGINPGVSRKILSLQADTSDYLKRLAGESRIYISSDDEYELKFSRFMRFDTFNPGEDWFNLRSVELPNINILDNIASANNFDPMVPSRYLTWMRLLDGTAQNQKNILNNLLNLSGIGLVEKVDNSASTGVRFIKIPSPAYVRFVPCMLTVENGAQTLDLLRQDGFDFEQKVVIENPSHDYDFLKCDNSDIHTVEPDIVQFVRKGYRTLTIEANNSYPGILVIADVWFPGWTATINGKEGEILKADYLFKGVYLDPGPNIVDIVYTPKSFQWGLGITGFVMIAGLIAFLVYWKYHA